MLILNQIQNITKGAAPVILVGGMTFHGITRDVDFNDVPSSDVYKVVTARPINDPARFIIMQNAEQLSKFGHHGPSNSACIDWDLRHSSWRRSDYIFVWKGTHVVHKYLLCQGASYNLEVTQHGVASDFWDNFYLPSDHLPVIADLSLTKQYSLLFSSSYF